MPTSIRLHEVSPRDGLQNEPEVLPTDVKVALIERLVGAGFRDLEVTSFVRPQAIPQLTDAAEVVARLPQAEGVRYWALVPNPVGLERALDAGVRCVATFLSASETHNKKNVNRTVRESLAGLRKVVGTAVAEGLVVRSYISTVFGCPYEGDVPIERTLRLALDLLEAGAEFIAIGDTTGMGVPDQVSRGIETLLRGGVPIERLAVHFHDTRGTALANAWAAYGLGVRTFDGSIAGIGGCPYAPGAAGNAATEDLLHLFHRAGCESGVDLEAACEVGAFVAEALGRPLPGRYHQYWLGRRDRRVRAAQAGG